MTVIGTFRKTDDGYAGTIRTMTINVKASFVANDKNGNDKAPDFKVVAGDRDLGAAWKAKARGEDGREFLRVELDDPGFAAPIRAALFENGEEGKGRARSCGIGQHPGKFIACPNSNFVSPYHGKI